MERIFERVWPSQYWVLEIDGGEMYAGVMLYGVGDQRVEKEGEFLR